MSAMGLFWPFLSHPTDTKRLNLNGFVWVCYAGFRFFVRSNLGSFKNRKIGPENPCKQLILFGMGAMGLFWPFLSHPTDTKRLNLNGFVWVCFAGFRFFVRSRCGSSKNRKIEHENRCKRLILFGMSAMGLFCPFSRQPADTKGLNLNGFVWVCFRAWRLTSAPQPFHHHFASTVIRLRRLIRSSSKLKADGGPSNASRCLPLRLAGPAISNYLKSAGIAVTVITLLNFHKCKRFLVTND
jgi:hypothetical protein